MRFSRRWLDTEAPATPHLVDAALVAALLPHLPLLRMPMLLYGILILFLLFRGTMLQRKGLVAIGVLGALAVAVSFLGAFSFVGFSELGTFIQVVSALLLYAVSLQRLTGTVNFYLLLSPMLLLALSYFFYNTIFMLVYAVGVLYLFLLLMLWKRMQAPLIEALRAATMLFAGALPVVVLLFAVFPRISFERSEKFGFKETAAIRTGHDGLMHTGSEALLVPSQRIAMEVWFETGMPPSQALYFRGSVLYTERGDVWQPLLSGREFRVLSSTRAEGVRYRVTLYPHRKRWVYLLDYPLGITPRANYTADRVAFWDVPVSEVMRYEAVSRLSDRTPAGVAPQVLDAALEVYRGRDPRSEAAMTQLRLRHDSTAARIAALNDWFRAQRLAYTLKPEIPDRDHPVDNFLFDTRKGYCVHFASAYATLARMLEVPSRVVTGYKGDASKGIENYLPLREEDAHAWVEVYDPAQGWERIDPTTFSSGVAATDRVTLELLNAEQGVWRRLNDWISLRVLYVKYVINKWILYYDRSRQMALLRELLENTLFALQLVAAFALLSAAGVALFFSLRRQQCGDAALCAMQPLLKTLRGAGEAKRPGEDMHTFLQRVSQRFGCDLSQVDEAYHRLRYGDEKDGASLERLKGLCRAFKL